MIDLSKEIEIEILQAVDWCYYLVEADASKKDIKKAFANAYTQVLKMKREIDREE